MKRVNHSDILKIKHGGFKSFLNKAIEMGVDIQAGKEEPSLIKLQYKNKIIFCKRGVVPIIKRAGNLAINKSLTKAVLDNSHIKTPKGIKSKNFKNTTEEIQKKGLNYPLILKPIDGSLAKGVVWNINSQKELKSAVQNFIEFKEGDKKSTFLVEEMHLGNEYRILVFNGKIMGCVNKIPASVTGDGKSTIDQLITKFNKTRRSDLKIKVDKEVKNTLKNNDLTLQSILDKNKTLKLRYNLNMSDGGRSIDCTETMHPFFKKICLLATEYCGLYYGGLDLITRDISQKTEDYVILEINSNPYYNMHESPLIEGAGMDVSKEILLYLFPNLKRSKTKK